MTLDTITRNERNECQCVGGARYVPMHEPVAIAPVTVYVSGTYSGPNPSPGVGIARSLREAYPGERLIGVDYSPRATGLHVPEFDDVWVLPGWRDLDLELHARQIADRLDSGGLWISGLDLEVLWGARALKGVRGWLGPGTSALRRVRKPPSPPPGTSWLTPEWVSLSENDQVLHAFCRRHSWQIWVKGPFYEARFVTTWPEFTRARLDLDQTWAGAANSGFVQEHIPAREGAVMLTSLDGRLLDAVWMEKREITPEGKTWSASVNDVPRDLRTVLETYVRRLDWTGGAEIELLFDASGQTWLMEWNPRFPAWVYGATLAGHNMPAALVAAARGEPAPMPYFRSQQFVRVVHEIPTRPGLAIPGMSERSRSVPSLSKHPSGMPDLARRLSRPSVRAVTSLAEAPELSVIRARHMRTPIRVLQPNRAKKLMRATIAAAQRASTDVEIVIAYSIKTDPARRLMKLALAEGLWFEAITHAEVDAALRLGVRPERIILNGPAKWWPVSHHASQLAAVFFDSVEELRRFGGESVARHAGPRLRLPRTNSRFGVRLERPRDADQLLSALRGLASPELGVHFHLASSTIGTDRWLDMADSAIEWSSLIAREARAPSLIDFGGGWHPDDWAEQLLPQLAALADRARLEVPSARQIVFEPGKAITQESSVLLTRVQEVRHEGRHSAVVVDASVADLPEARRFPRRIWRCEQGSWRDLEDAGDVIWGRSCMEHDVLADNVDARGLKVGDLMAIGSAGAYDSSMAYRFAYGS